MDNLVDSFYPIPNKKDLEVQTLKEKYISLPEHLIEDVYLQCKDILTADQVLFEMTRETCNQELIPPLPPREMSSGYVMQNDLEQFGQAGAKSVLESDLAQNDQLKFSSGARKPVTYGNPMQHIVMKNTQDRPFLNAIAGSIFGKSKSPQYELSDEQKVQFMQEGFIQLPGIVKIELVNVAKRAINRFLSRPCSESDAMKYRNESYGDMDLMTSDDIRDLMYKSGVLSIVESLVGRAHPVWAGQIALRFPGYFTVEEFIKNPQLAKGFKFLKMVTGKSQNAMTPVPNFHKHWHIDGLPGGKTPLGEFHNFSLLVGVILGTLHDINCGNLTIFPGAHLILQKFFQDHGIENVANMPPQEFEKIREKMNIGEPYQVTGNPGDVIIAHHNLPHTVSPNLSPDIRYAVYFRVTAGSRPEGAEYYPEAMTNIWLEFEGVHHLI